jgi:hypothetical protein
LTYEQALKEEGIYRSVAAGSSFRLIVVGYGKSAVGLYHYQGSLEIAQGIKTSLFERTTETLCLEIR